MSRVTIQGLPTSVSTQADLPVHAYDGHLCYVKEDGDLYIYTGSEYSSIASGGGGGGGGTGVTKLPVYSKTTDLPENASEGNLVWVTSTKAPYVYSGTAWKKLTLES